MQDVSLVLSQIEQHPPIIARVFGHLLHKRVRRREIGPKSEELSAYKLRYLFFLYSFVGEALKSRFTEPMLVTLMWLKEKNAFRMEITSFQYGGSQKQLDLDGEDQRLLNLSSTAAYIKQRGKVAVHTRPEDLFPNGGMQFTLDMYFPSFTPEQIVWLEKNGQDFVPLLKTHRAASTLSFWNFVQVESLFCRRSKVEDETVSKWLLSKERVEETVLRKAAVDLGCLCKKLFSCLAFVALCNADWYGCLQRFEIDMVKQELEPESTEIETELDRLVRALRADKTTRADSNNNVISGREVIIARNFQSESFAKSVGGLSQSESSPLAPCNASLVADAACVVVSDVDHDSTQRTVEGSQVSQPSRPAVDALAAVADSSVAVAPEHEENSAQGVVGLEERLQTDAESHRFEQLDEEVATQCRGRKAQKKSKKKSNKKRAKRSGTEMDKQALDEPGAQKKPRGRVVKLHSLVEVKSSGAKGATVEERTKGGIKEFLVDFVDRQPERWKREDELRRLVNKAELGDDGSRFAAFYSEKVKITEGETLLQDRKGVVVRVQELDKEALRWKAIQLTGPEDQLGKCVLIPKSGWGWSKTVTSSSAQDMVSRLDMQKGDIFFDKILQRGCKVTHVGFMDDGTWSCVFDVDSLAAQTFNPLHSSNAVPLLGRKCKDEIQTEEDCETIKRCCTGDEALTAEKALKRAAMWYIQERGWREQQLKETLSHIQSKKELSLSVLDQEGKEKQVSDYRLFAVAVQCYDDDRLDFVHKKVTRYENLSFAIKAVQGARFAEEISIRENRDATLADFKKNWNKETEASTAFTYRLAGRLIWKLHFDLGYLSKAVLDSNRAMYAAFAVLNLLGPQPVEQQRLGRNGVTGQDEQDDVEQDENRRKRAVSEDEVLADSPSKHSRTSVDECQFPEDFSVEPLPPLPDNISMC